jgi:putative transposase
MPEALKRYHGRGHLHFITFSCYQRLPLLGTAYARNVFVEALAEIRSRYDFPLAGYVVIPEHVHLLVGEPRIGNRPVILKVLKQRVSRDLRREKGTLTASQQQLPCFWHARFYGFNVYSTEKMKEKLDYMHANPVNRGLVENPCGWVWSSFSSYSGVGTGLVTIDPVG